MDIKKLDSWAEQLLDTGKRNNLVNFKDTKSSSVEVVLPEISSIFEKADSSASFEVFDPKLDTDEDDVATINKVCKKISLQYIQPIVVEVEPLRCFYSAEEYHQDYLDKNPGGYCHIPRSMFALAKSVNRSND